jgi:hypothetical protein
MMAHQKQSERKHKVKHRNNLKARHETGIAETNKLTAANSSR